MTVFSRISNGVDLINGTVGRFVKYLIAPLVLICLFEVMMRYVFNKPTDWAWELDTFFLSIMGLMGAGYTQLHRTHIRVDVLINLPPPKIRIAIELVASFIFLLSLLILLHEVGKMVSSSVKELERSHSFWGPPIWPLKIQILILVFLLFLQCLVQFFNQIGEYMNLWTKEDKAKT